MSVTNRPALLPYPRLRGNEFSIPVFEAEGEEKKIK
jgi:hypothetical protein